jgi:hypothetical protein
MAVITSVLEDSVTLIESLQKLFDNADSVKIGRVYPFTLKGYQHGWNTLHAIKYHIRQEIN